MMEDYEENQIVLLPASGQDSISILEERRGMSHDYNALETW